MSSRRRPLFVVGRSLAITAWILRDLCEINTVSDGELWSDKVLFHKYCSGLISPTYMCISNLFAATLPHIFPIFCYQGPSGRCLDQVFRLTSGCPSRRLLETAVLTLSIFFTLTLKDTAPVPMLSF